MYSSPLKFHVPAQPVSELRCETDLHRAPIRHLVVQGHLNPLSRSHLSPWSLNYLAASEAKASSIASTFSIGMSVISR